METLIHADIFFFITTIAIVILTIIMAIVLVYFIVILNDIRYISRKVRKESDVIIDDVHHLRDQIKTQGMSLGYLFTFFKRLFVKGKTHRKATREE